MTSILETNLLYFREIDSSSFSRNYHWRHKAAVDAISLSLPHSLSLTLSLSLSPFLSRLS